MSFSITGLDKLQRDLKDAQQAFASLDGTIATLRFDPHNQASVNAAIQQMESAIDAKTGGYRGNPLVESVAKGLKEQYRKAILERATKERSQPGHT
jgi:hypothetical protein